MLTLTPGNVENVRLDSKRTILDLRLKDGAYEREVSLDLADLGNSGYSIKKLELSSENYLIVVVCGEKSDELTEVSVSFNQISAACSNQLRLAA